MADPPDPVEPTPVELHAAPTITGRIAGWAARARILRSQIEAARARHASVDCAFDLVERDSTIGGGMLGGALAYRLFVFLLPLVLFLVAGLGVYADVAGMSPSDAASYAGLTGLIAREVSATASSSARWAIFIVTFPVLLYATGMLYRAVAIVHAIAWHGSGREVPTDAPGVRDLCRTAGDLSRLRRARWSGTPRRRSWRRDRPCRVRGAAGRRMAGPHARASSP